MIKSDLLLAHQPLVHNEVHPCDTKLLFQPRAHLFYRGDVSRASRKDGVSYQYALLVYCQTKNNLELIWPMVPAVAVLRQLIQLVPSK